MVTKVLPHLSLMMIIYVSVKILLPMCFRRSINCIKDRVMAWHGDFILSRIPHVKIVKEHVRHTVDRTWGKRTRVRLNGSRIDEATLIINI